MCRGTRGAVCLPGKKQSIHHDCGCEWMDSYQATPVLSRESEREQAAIGPATSRDSGEGREDEEE